MNRSSDMTSQNTSLALSDLPTDGQNNSTPKGCTEVRFGEWEYLPWNNPENIVSHEATVHASQVRSGTVQILFLIGGPANVLNMAVFLSQGLKDRVNLLLFSLALADEICLIAGILNYAQDFYLQLTGAPTPGPLYVFVINNNVGVFHSFCVVSFLLSAIIACERCCCVLMPLKYQTLMRTRTLAVVIITVYVTVPCVYLLVVFRYYFACVYDPDTGFISKMFSPSKLYRHHKDLIDYTDNIVFGAGLPSVTMVVLVTATLITTWKLRQVVAWRTETASSVSAREVALTKMLVATSMLLIVCIFPMCLLRVASLFLPELNTGRRHQNLYLTCLRISMSFTYINSTFNIFIYYVMGSRYRETLRALFKRKAKKNINEK